MQYRRAKVKGGTYFITINLMERDNTLLVDKFDKLRIAFNKVKNTHPFKLDAMVVLPNHLHVLMTLPEDDNDFPLCIRLVKSGFSRQIPKRERIRETRKSKGKRGIWQRRYWEYLIRDDKDYENHIHYVHHNPVKHGILGTQYLIKMHKKPRRLMYSHDMFILIEDRKAV